MLRGRVSLSWRALCYLAAVVASLLCTSVGSIYGQVVEFDGPRVEPFDARRLLKLDEAGLEEFPPLGPVRVIRGLMASPSFWPISLSVYTRQRTISDIYLKPVDHHLLKQSQDEPRMLRYEYNLSQLMPPQNPFKPHRRTIIFIPGYLSGLYVEWMQESRKSWLELEDVNVILVHWSGGNKGLYSTAVSNVKLIARQVTIFLYYLAQLHGLDFESASFRSSITLVGHSLGAHVAAFVGQELGGQVGRITGLDPAGPIFDKQKSQDRLDPSDAQLVDILHTNGGRMRYMKAGVGFLKSAGKRLVELWTRRQRASNNQTGALAGSLLNSYSSDEESPWFGLEHPSGHLDYYANGGSVQPGCGDPLHLCDHRRAYAIYREALEFELRARQLYAGSESLSEGFHRLVAFPSADYLQFRSGSSIMRNCPMLITAGHLMDARSRHLAYRQCTIPMDFVTEGPRLRRELEEEYGLPLSSLDHLPDRPLSDWRPSDFEERRLYFETMSREPLVGEHHLMQVHLTKGKRIDWSQGCRFTCKLESQVQRELYSLIDYVHASLEPLEYNQFYGLCFIFANPSDWRYETPLAELTSPAPQYGFSTTLDPWTDDNSLSGFLSVEVSYNGVSLNNIRSSGGKDSRQCKLDINSVRMRPLTALAYNVSAWYSAGDPSTADPTGGGSGMLLHSKWPL